MTKTAHPPETRLCLTCREPLMPSQKKYCCKKCARIGQHSETYVAQHNIVVGNIEIVARMAEGNMPEWILPGCQVVSMRSQAERAATLLDRWQRGIAA